MITEIERDEAVAASCATVQTPAPSDPTAFVDRVQAAIAQYPPVDLPLRHTFTPGLYTRSILMPAGALIVSKIHKTEHQFVISAGACRVWDAEHGVQTLRAPHFGVTQPGTRRILYILEDCLWTTCHATPHTTPEAVEADIIEPHTVPPEITAEIHRLLKGTAP